MQQQRPNGAKRGQQNRAEKKRQQPISFFMFFSVQLCYLPFCQAESLTQAGFTTGLASFPCSACAAASAFPREDAGFGIEEGGFFVSPVNPRFGGWYADRRIALRMSAPVLPLLLRPYPLFVR